MLSSFVIDWKFITKSVTQLYLAKCIGFYGKIFNTHLASSYFPILFSLYLFQNYLFVLYVIMLYASFHASIHFWKKGGKTTEPPCNIPITLMLEEE